LTSRDQQRARVQELLRKGEGSLLASLLDLERRSAPVAAAAVGRRLRTRLERAAVTPLSPWTYLLYYRIGQCVLTAQDRGERFDQLLAWLQTELGLPATAGGVVGFADPDRPAWQWQELLALFQEGGDFIADLDGPEPGVIKPWRQQIDSIRSLLAWVDPPLHALMQHLQSVIVLARPGALARQSGQGFGGASTFFFRGGSVINCTTNLAPAQLLERLVHEFAHAELFVLGQDERLCHNDDGERHGVLIRPDPRPMHGIIHSLYVTARCAELFLGLLAHSDSQPLWPAGLAPGLKPMLGRLTALGQSSLKAVERHGVLTPIGEEVVAVSRERLGVRGPDGP